MLYAKPCILPCEIIARIASFVSNIETLIDILDAFQYYMTPDDILAYVKLLAPKLFDKFHDFCQYIRYDDNLCDVNIIIPNVFNVKCMPNLDGPISIVFEETYNYYEMVFYNTNKYYYDCTCGIKKCYKVISYTSNVDSPDFKLCYTRVGYDTINVVKKMSRYFANITDRRRLVALLNNNPKYDFTEEDLQKPGKNKRIDRRKLKQKFKR